MSVHWGGKGPGHVSRWPRGVGAISPYSGATMLLDFLNPVLDPRITFSRGTGATRVNASGFIETVGNTTPRFDYDPVTLAPRGLLIEEARTNLLLRSEEFNDAAWPKVSLTVTANATTAPNGTVTADKLIPDAAGSGFYVEQQLNVTSGTTYTGSVFLKAAELSNSVSLQFSTGALWPTGNPVIVVNLANGTIVSSANASAVSLVNFGNGWYRLAVTQTASSTGTSGLRISPSSGVAGNGTNGIYAWGGQMEIGSFATSYIPTVASTVTRNADVATMTGTNFSSWYNQSEGTFVTDASMLALNAVSTQELLALDDSGVSNNIFLRANNTSGSTSATATTGGVSQGFLDIAGTVAGVPQKVAYGIKLNDAALVRNGGTVITDTTYAVPTGQNRMAIGARLTAFAFLNGHIRTIAYFNTRLPNAQLQTLTAPSLATTLSLDFTSGSYNVGF